MRLSQPGVFLSFVVWISAGVVIVLTSGNWAWAAVASLLPSLGVLGVWIYRRWLDAST
jgi:membrane protein implicated in regulation of membrane protease activity